MRGGTRRTGNLGGEPRIVQLKKVDPLTFWALNRDPLRPPRTPDVLVPLNSYAAMIARMTTWQVQAAIHSALESITLRDGTVRLASPDSGLVRNFILRRYGAWTPDLQMIGAALRKAEAEQLPLFDEDEGAEEGDDDGDDE